MKTMSFPRSCAYTAVANLLEHVGIDTTDRDMILEIGLPYQFRQEDGAYLAGAMLQTKDWFDRFLNPRGFHLVEAYIPCADLPSFLEQRQEPCMLGVQLQHGKHALNFHHWEQNTLVFSNNRHPASDEPDYVSFTAEELLERVDETVVVGMLEKCPNCSADTSDDSIETEMALRSYRETLAEIWPMMLPQMRVLEKLNSVFAPLFLDVPIMMDLIGRHQLAQTMISMRTTFLSALRQTETICLNDVIPWESLSELLDNYQAVLLS